MPRLSTRLWLLLGLGSAAGLGLAVLAFLSLRVLSPGGTVAPDNCTPKPCSAPNGFGAYLSDVAVVGGQVRMTVNFVNHPHEQTFSGYNHTSPADFQLRDAGGAQVKPVFGNGCPDWGELKINIGAAAGPEPLCFPASSTGTRGALLVWGPDLGLAFDDVRIALE